MYNFKAEQKQPAASGYPDIN